METIGSTPAVVATFRILQGPLKGKKLRFETNLITIGRSEEANIRLPGDRSVSRIHAEVHLVDGHYVLQNRSDSGTFVNDKLVERKVLQSGDRILIGEHHLLDFVEVNGASPAAAPSKLRGSKLVIGGAVYLMLLAGLAVFLSHSGSAGSNAADGQQIQDVMSRYAAYVSSLHLPQEEQDAQLRAVEAYLRAGLIAERQGRYDEARQIYLRLMEFVRERNSPVYQYAIVRLRRVPDTR